MDESVFVPPPWARATRRSTGVRPMDTLRYLSRKDISDLIAVNEWWQRMRRGPLDGCAGNAESSTPIVLVHPAYANALASLHVPKLKGQGRTAEDWYWLDDLVVWPDRKVRRGEVRYGDSQCAFLAIR